MGNQASGSQNLGEKLNNDMTVTWKKVTDCSFPLREGQCACSHGKSMFCFGGVIQTDEDHLESNDLLQFDTVNNTWTLVECTGSFPEPRSASSIVCVGDKLYLFGGLNQEAGWLNDMYMFDTNKKVWTEVKSEGNKPSPRDKLQGTVVDKCIYYFGGFGPKQTGDEQEDWEDLEDDDDDDVLEEERTQQAAHFGWFNDLFCFDTGSNKWSQPMHMNLGVPTARAAHGMCTVGRNLVIFGGRDTEKRTNDIHIFNVDTRKWEMDMKCTGQWPEPRSFHTVTGVNKRVVVMGGRSQDNQHLADCHIFDTETKEWLQPTVQGDIPEARGQHSVVVAGDKLVLYGGSALFSPETMMCQKFYGDSYVLSIGDLLKGGSIRNTETSGNGDHTNS